MKFLMDVCAGGRLSQWLTDQGHEVREVRKRDQTMADEEVINWAVEEKRIIITVDKDFGELSVAKGKPHCGIIRLPDVSFIERKHLLSKVIERHSGDLKQGRIITVSRTRIRVRK